MECGISNNSHKANNEILLSCKRIYMYNDIKQTYLQAPQIGVPIRS